MGLSTASSITDPDGVRYGGLCKQVRRKLGYCEDIYVSMIVFSGYGIGDVLEESLCRGYGFEADARVQKQEEVQAQEYLATVESR